MLLRKRWIDICCLAVHNFCFTDSTYIRLFINSFSVPSVTDERETGWNLSRRNFVKSIQRSFHVSSKRNFVKLGCDHRYADGRVYSSLVVESGGGWRRATETRSVSGVKASLPCDRNIVSNVACREVAAIHGKLNFRNSQNLGERWKLRAVWVYPDTRVRSLHLRPLTRGEGVKSFASVFKRSPLSVASREFLRQHPNGGCAKLQNWVEIGNTMVLQILMKTDRVNFNGQSYFLNNSLFLCSAKIRRILLLLYSKFF